MTIVSHWSLNREMCLKTYRKGELPPWPSIDKSSKHLVNFEIPIMIKLSHHNVLLRTSYSVVGEICYEQVYFSGLKVIFIKIIYPQIFQITLALTTFVDSCTPVSCCWCVLQDAIVVEMITKLCFSIERKVALFAPV